MASRKIIKVRKEGLIKKAVVFTLISALFATLFIVLFSYDFQVLYEDTLAASNMRIKVMDNYVKNFQPYVENSMKVATYQTLTFMYNDSMSQGKYYTGEAAFNGTFSNCSVCGYTDCLLKIKSCTGSLYSFVNTIAQAANSSLNINTTFNITWIKIYQKLPFDIEISVNITYNVSDMINAEFVSWQDTIILNQTISIVGLKDPLIGINTLANGSSVNKSISKNSVCPVESCWNLANVRTFFNNGEYTYLYNGTSFLQRFWNDTSKPSSCCGIETFLDNSIANYSSFNSYDDNFYWTGKFNCTLLNYSGLYTGVQIVQIDNITPGFKIDSKTAARYLLINESTLVCPVLT